jgi:MFS family permease
MLSVKTKKDSISRGYGFLKRQQRDWKVSAVRSNLHFFFHKMVNPYVSVYIVALGASATQLGILNSIGMISAGLVSPFIGMWIDRIGVKRIYLLTIVMLSIAYLVYGISQSWIIAIIAMVTFWLGNSPSLQACGVICANSLSTEERATGMALCETMGIGAVGIIAPMLGAFLVSTFGGINADGIRPLFFISLAGTICTFFLIFTQLSDKRWSSSSRSSSNIFKGVSEIFKKGHNLKRWILISSITSLPMGMVMPYRQVFAHDIKGADEYILGAMVMAAGLVPIFLGLIMGRLADKLGRKKLIYASIPFVWISNLILIWAPNPGWLVVAGAFQGFFLLSGLPTRAMDRELVPPEYMGRWLGILDFSKMMFASISVYLGGVIWDNIGPHYVFLVIIATDVLIRIPLLLGMPETLQSNDDRNNADISS